MSSEPSTSTDRRSFLQAGALATASAVSLGAGLDTQAQETNAKVLSIPRRPLGKTGVDVTILNAGTGKGAGIQRILRYAYSQGIRCFDTSERYQSEPDFKLWFQQEPEVRKQIFVVTKDLPQTPAQMMGKLDQRLANMGTDYLDLFFIHSFGDNHSLDDGDSASSRAASSRRRPTRFASRARRSSSASRPITRTEPRSSRRRPRGASSTRSWSRTLPGWTRTHRSTRHSTPAGRRGSG